MFAKPSARKTLLENNCDVMRYVSTLRAQKTANTFRASQEAPVPAGAHEEAQKAIAAHKATVAEQIAKNAQPVSSTVYRLPEAKVWLVVRIKGINKCCPKTRTILRLLRLHQINSAVFVRVNKATINMIKRVEPYITYGQPSVETVQALLKTRGNLRLRTAVHEENAPLTDELVAGQNWETVKTVDGVAHEIISLGSNFKTVNNALAPFKLSCPKGGLICKRRSYLMQQKGDWGHRGAAIDTLVGRMI